MKKILENVAEMTTVFWDLVRNGKISLDTKYDPSVWECFKELLPNMAEAFEKLIDDGVYDEGDYLYGINHFTKKALEMSKNVLASMANW